MISGLYIFLSESIIHGLTPYMSGHKQSVVKLTIMHLGNAKNIKWNIF